jgi:preprotein translocase subunit YajC
MYMMNPAWAQGLPGGHGPPALMQFAPLAIIFAVFYFLLIRPQQQKAKEQRLMIENLKRNDEVITTGGLYGKIVQLSEKVLTLEIAPNVRVRVERAQVAALASSAAAKSGAPDDTNKDKEKDKAK